MKYEKIIYFAFLILLIILSFIPRGTEFVNKNYVFGFDQGRDYLDVQKIVDQHKFTLIGTEIGAGSAGFKFIFHGPGYYYLLTIPYILFKGDPYGGVVLMFFLGLVSIALSFFAGNKIFGKYGGLTLALLVAVSPPLISQSRFIWNSYPSTLFIILIYYFIYLSNKNRKFLFLAGFFSAFVYNFELALAVPLVISVIIYSIFILKVRNIKSYLILILTIFIGFLPMFLFETRHGFLGLKSILGYIFYSQSKTQLPSISLYNPSHINAFMFNFRDSFPQLDPGILEVILFALMFVSFLVMLWKEKPSSLKNLLLYLLSLPLITYFIFSFLRNAVWQHYLYHLLIGYLFIFTYILITAFKKKMFVRYLLTVFVVIFLYRGVVNANAIYNQDFANYYGGTAKIKGKTDTLDYIYKDAKGEKFGLFIFAPPIYTYPFDYLISWYGKNKYGFVPYNDKKGLFYLLIEKDGSKPWTYQGWMETVIKTGKVLETKRLLPSDFIIQKRYQE